MAVVLPCYGTLVALAYVLTADFGAHGLAWSYTGAMCVAVVASAIVVQRLGIWGDRAVPAGGLAHE